MPTLFVLTRDVRPFALGQSLSDYVLGVPRWEKTQVSLSGGTSPDYFHAQWRSGPRFLPDWTERQMRLLQDMWPDMFLRSEDLNMERYGTVLTTVEGRSINKTRPLESQ